MLKVGLDLDGTIDHIPDFFQILSKATLDAGGIVHVITFRDSENEARQYLKKLGIKYSELHLPGGEPSAPEWKARLARELRLDVFFEDSLEVLRALPDTCKTVWVADRDVFNLNHAIHGLINPPNTP